MEKMIAADKDSSAGNAIGCLFSAIQRIN